jgi:hypothetical protein
MGTKAGKVKQAPKPAQPAPTSAGAPPAAPTTAKASMPAAAGR